MPEEFRETALTKLARENVYKPIALSIVEKVWHELDSKDIRDVIKVGRLASSSEEISFVVKMLKKSIALLLVIYYSYIFSCISKKTSLTDS